MNLPNGITGFYLGENTKPPNVDGKRFKQLCFAIVSRNGGKVINVSPPQYPVNFYCAHVEFSRDVFYILVNEHYPYLAFASVVAFGEIKFIDVPALHELFSPFYQVIDAAELNVSVDQKMLMKMELNSAELEQAAYWKPQTIGQVIFNYWD